MATRPKTKIIGHPWNFCVLWNQALDAVPQKPLVKREHCWASELGGAFVDRYLRMHAVPYTNPPNARSRRKFLMGDIVEWIASIVMVTIGLMRERQVRAEVELPKLLRVTGKVDFVAGGVVDWEKGYYDIQKIKAIFSSGDAPKFIAETMEYVFGKMKKAFGNKQLMDAIFECKSLSSPMFQKVQKIGRPLSHHILQLGHYLIPNKDIAGKVGYICKDDALMEEYDMTLGIKFMEAYRRDVETMTEYYHATGRNIFKTKPPVEPQVLFDPLIFRFEKNFKVEYSPYLELVYNFKTPEDFRKKWTKQVSDWNRVFKRCVNGEKMTPANIVIIRSAAKLWPDWDKWVDKARKEGAFLKPEEIEEDGN